MNTSDRVRQATEQLVQIGAYRMLTDSFVNPAQTSTVRIGLQSRELDEEWRAEIAIKRSVDESLKEQHGN